MRSLANALNKCSTLNWHSILGEHGWPGGELYQQKILAGAINWVDEYWIRDGKYRLLYLAVSIKDSL